MEEKKRVRHQHSTLTAELRTVTGELTSAKAALEEVSAVESKEQEHVRRRLSDRPTRWIGAAAAACSACYAVGGLRDGAFVALPFARSGQAVSRSRSASKRMRRRRTSRRW